jgi:SAM-dependent methyltransferase
LFDAGIRNVGFCCMMRGRRHHRKSRGSTAPCRAALSASRPAAQTVLSPIVAMKDWVAFYDSPHSIYVNARHRDLHYQRLADDIARHVPGPSAAVLDYGCGEALYADRVAAAAGRLVLAEAGSSVRAKLIQRFAGNPRITVVSTDRVGQMPANSFDLVVMHSVSQYLTGQEFDRTAALFHRLLKPGGLLLVGDVLPPKVPIVADVIALLRYGWADGFFFAAIGGLIRTFFSEYARLRTSIGLTRYTENEMREKLAAPSFAVTRAEQNIGHLTTRMTFLARKSNPIAAPAG